MTYLVIAFCFGLAGGIVGKVKGSSFFIWFLISASVPVIGLIVALLYRWEKDELRRQCPTCGAVLPIYQALCTRCGTELDYPEEILEPASVTEARARAARSA